MQALNLANMLGQLKDTATKAEITATLQFAAQHVPFWCAEHLAVCFKDSFQINLLQKMFKLDLPRCHI